MAGSGGVVKWLPCLRLHLGPGGKPGDGGVVVVITDNSSTSSTGDVSEQLKPKSMPGAGSRDEAFWAAPEETSYSGHTSDQGAVPAVIIERG